MTGFCPKAVIRSGSLEALCTDQLQNSASSVLGPCWNAFFLASSTYELHKILRGAPPFTRGHARRKLCGRGPCVARPGEEKAKPGAFALLWQGMPYGKFTMSNSRSTWLQSRLGFPMGQDTRGRPALPSPGPELPLRVEWNEPRIARYEAQRIVRPPLEAEVYCTFTVRPLLHLPF